MLASAARLVLNQLGLDDPVSASPAATDAELIDLVTAELGADWPRLVAPVFEPKKAVLFDDRWASAREDLVKLWLTDEGDIDARWVELSERFEGAGHVVATQATWWQGKALAAGGRSTRRCSAGSRPAPRIRIPAPTHTKSPW